MQLHSANDIMLIRIAHAQVEGGGGGGGGGQDPMCGQMYARWLSVSRTNHL